MQASIGKWFHDARGCVSLCYDDGTESAWTFARPTLVRHHVAGTFYLNCGFWDEPGKEYVKLLRWGWAARDTEIRLGDHTWGHEGAADAASLRESMLRNAARIRALACEKEGALLSFGVPGGCPWNVSEEEFAAIQKELHEVVRPEFHCCDAPGGRGTVTCAADAIAIFDRAEADRGWECLLFHGVGGDWFPFPATEHEKLVHELSVRQMAGRLWVAAAIDGHKYEAERDGATLSLGDAEDDGSRVASLAVTTDPHLYDHPLTIVVTDVDAPAIMVSGKTVVRHSVPAVAGRARFEVPPVSGDIRITPVGSV